MIRGKDKDTGEQYRIIVADSGDRWVVAYEFEDDGIGHIFHEERLTDDVELETRVVHETLRDDPDRVETSNFRGDFQWETEAAAKRALKKAEAALKAAQANKPYPEWAKQALAAGWKPPRGWKL